MTPQNRRCHVLLQIENASHLGAHKLKMTRVSLAMKVHSKGTKTHNFKRT
jgi:hypothetical protein